MTGLRPPVTDAVGPLGRAGGQPNHFKDEGRDGFPARGLVDKGFTKLEDATAPGRGALHGGHSGSYRPRPLEYVGCPQHDQRGDSSRVGRHARWEDFGPTMTQRKWAQDV